MTDADVQEFILKHLSKQHNTRCGNYAMIHAIEEKFKAENFYDKYWEIRDELIRQGKIEVGLGKGGSIILIEPATEKKSSSEKSLYEPAKKAVEDGWAKSKSLGRFKCEITADQGRRKTGGKWTRPDLVVISYTMYDFLPEKIFNLYTFEIKTSDGYELTCVYEALAHRRFGTHSYVLIEGAFDEGDEIQSSIKMECEKFGVGLIFAETLDNHAEWVQTVEAVRHEPDPDSINEFISKQISNDTRQELLRWFRGG